MINFSSTNDVSRLFFGGYIKTKQLEPALNELGQLTIIKSGVNRGQVKTKLVERSYYIKGLELIPRPEWETKKKGIYQTNEKVLLTISTQPLMPLVKDNNQEAIKIARLMLQIREKEKLLSTYYTSYDKYIHQEDSCIHPQFNHCATQTGRTSGAKPNPQNIPS